MTKTFYLIRHGESESNAGIMTDHPATINLTQKGRAEAQAKADGFTKQPKRIVTSPFIRTKQTAAPFVAKFPDAQVEEWEMQEFTFLALDKYKNKTHEYRHPFLKAYWDNADPDYKDSPESESFREFIDRVKRVIEKMKKLDDGESIGFGHGYTMAGIVFVLGGKAEKIDGQTMRDFWDSYLKLMPRNVETLEFEIANDNVKYIPRPRAPSAPKAKGPKLND